MKEIIDEFTDRPVSRQRKLQLRWARDGFCILCRKDREKYASRCDSCHKKESERQRKRNGSVRRNKNKKFDPPGPHLGGTIKELRLRYGISAKQLIEFTCASDLSLIEHGRVEVGLVRLSRIAEGLGMKRPSATLLG